MPGSSRDRPSRIVTLPGHQSNHDRPIPRSATFVHGMRVERQTLRRTRASGSSRTPTRSPRIANGTPETTRISPAAAPSLANRTLANAIPVITKIASIIKELTKAVRVLNHFDQRSAMAMVSLLHGNPWLNNWSTAVLAVAVRDHSRSRQACTRHDPDDGKTHDAAEESGCAGKHGSSSHSDLTSRTVCAIQGVADGGVKGVPLANNAADGTCEVPKRTLLVSKRPSVTRVADVERHRGRPSAASSDAASPLSMLPWGQRCSPGSPPT